MLLAALLAAAASTASASAPAGDHQVRTRMWTVGTQAGSRPSTEVCRWSAEIVVGGRLDPSHKVSGSRAGNCHLVKRLVEADRARKIGQLQERLATAGHLAPAVAAN